ncbi:MAG: flagellar motor switch protein FliN [Nitrospirota bacterium]
MGNEVPKEKPLQADPKVVAMPAQAKTAPQPAALAPLKQQAATAQPGNLDFLLDVPLKISVRLGSAKMVIRDLLQLGQGSIIELEKMAGEPMDVLVGDKLVARGEVVVVNERFGVRLTDIVSTTERLQQLQKS